MVQSICRKGDPVKSAQSADAVEGRLQKDRLVELDLMRFVAAVAVVLHHLVGSSFSWYRATRLGFVGVELFFMISGFVILWTVNNKTGFEFVCSRISRLYPSFWICVCLTIVLLVYSGQAVSLRLLARCGLRCDRSTAHPLRCRGTVIFYKLVHARIN